MLAALIKAAMEQKGWSQPRLAAEAGISTGMVSMVCSGQVVNITPRMADKFAAPLGLDAEQVMAAALADVRSAPAPLPPAPDGTLRTAVA